MSKTQQRFKVARRVRRLGFSVAPLLLCCVALTSQAQSPGDPFAYSRTSDFSYRSDGLLASETIEPGQPQLCVVTTYNYDAYGNKADAGATKAATTANCAGASGLALITSRTSSAAYAAQSGRIGSAVGASVPIPAGTFATNAANALNQGESRTYDPRFGVAVSLTGPNALTTTWTLDDFGRKVQETRADGTKTAMYYCWLAVSFNGIAISTASNSPGCHNGSAPNLTLVPTPAANEAPADAVRYEHSVALDAAGTTAIGAFARTYYDRAGRKIRSVTQGYDGPGQVGGGARLIVADTDHNAYGVAFLSTAARFLDNNSSTTGGWSDYGITMSVFDALGRPTTVYTTDPNTPQQTGGSEVNGIQFGSRTMRRAAKTSIAYSGLVTVTTDDAGRTRKEEKNLDGKLVRVTDASGSTADSGAQIVHQHDAFGNLVVTKDALGNKIEIIYDYRGRKISLNDPDAGVTAYCYDALGQLKAQQSSNQRASHVIQACPSYNGAGSTVPAGPSAAWTHLAYDQLGRMTQRVEPEYTSNWSYDGCAMGVGKLCQTSTSHGITKTLVYDSLGRPANTRTDITSGPSTAAAVAYDGNGRVASQRYPSGVQLSYQYTAKGYLQAVKLDTAVSVTPLAGSSCTPAASCTLAAGTALWSATAVNAWGKAEQSAYANGINSSAVYEPFTGRLHNLSAGPGTTKTVVDQRYSWDSVNLLTQRIDAIGDQTGIQVRDDFTYDRLGRLTQYVVNGGSGATAASRTVALAYNALGLLLSKSDVGNFSYPTQGVANGRPHAVQSVSGIATNYSYDLNGNAGTATAGKWRSINYTSFNLPGNVPGDQGIDGPGATPKSIWQYDEGHQRVKEVRTNTSGTRTTWYLHPDNQGGLGFEREVAANRVQSNRHYISAGGSAFAVLVTTGALPTLAAAKTFPDLLTTVTAVKLEYWHKDHLGSLIATTDHAGVVTERYAYDPFGKRRKTDSSYDAFGTLVIDWTTDTAKGTDRGFTGHEHLDELGLVHMNGRIFDPLIGRFLQTDPFIQAPDNLQNYDRFAYCFNSPTVCTDPSGQLSAYLKNPVRAAKYYDPAGNYVMTKTAQNKYGYMIGSVAIGVASLYCGPWYAACVAGGTAAWSTFAGASDAQAFRNGAIAGATAYAMNAVGSATTTQGYMTVEDVWISGSVNVPANVAGHALVGCASSAAGGGSCQSGALSGAFGAALSASGLYNTGSGLSNKVIATIQHSIAGGIGSVLGGGKFANGAVTGAFGYLFNCSLHPGACSKAEIDDKVANCKGTQCYSEANADYREAGLLKSPDMGSVLKDFGKIVWKWGVSVFVPPLRVVDEIYEGGEIAWNASQDRSVAADVSGKVAGKVAEIAAAKVLGGSLSQTAIGITTTYYGKAVDEGTKSVVESKKP
jgi:RHS repeat-associated protein